MVGLIMVPSELEGEIRPEKEWRLDGLVDVHVQGEAYSGGWAQGRTLRNGPFARQFTYDSQDVAQEGDQTTIITKLRNTRGHFLEHKLTWHKGEGAVEVVSTFHNQADRAVRLELLTSFVLGGLTPFWTGDTPDILKLHRMLSAWSAEGRHVSSTIEQLHLERSWSGGGVRCERYGQVGSMPVRGYFPFVAVEDTQKGVFWGAHLAWAGSWQMEAYRRDDVLSLSGGHADREYGHWYKDLAPGESLSSPTAYVSTVKGDLDLLCHSLTSVQKRYVPDVPEAERDLPVIFNEYCTTWGNPTHENLIKITESLKNKGFRYLVMDAGWCSDEPRSWGVTQGDWVPSRVRFPQGLEHSADSIRQAGMIPGIWFEFEVCGPRSEAYSNTDHMVKRDGHVVTVGSRRFWDMRDPFVIDYLSERVIGLLEKCGFGYLKVDYNDTIGIGIDGAESLGEGLRQHIEGVYAFFRKIRERLPDLVIENCSSGGHRLEPSMMALTNMSSFSDAHETVAIPIIAANLQRLILPQQSQIWAVLRSGQASNLRDRSIYGPEYGTSEDSEISRRISYLLAATFLGRMCLSGDVYDLNDDQWQLVTDAQQLYKQVSHIIRNGFSCRFGPEVTTYLHPKGWQAILRTSPDEKEAMLVVHTFAQPMPESVQIELPTGQPWQVKRCFPASASNVSIDGYTLNCPLLREFSGFVVYVSR